MPVTPKFVYPSVVPCNQLEHAVPDPYAATYVDWGAVVYSESPLATIGALNCSLLAVDFGDAAILAHIYGSTAHPSNPEAYINTVAGMIQETAENYGRDLTTGTGLLNVRDMRRKRLLMKELDGMLLQVTVTTWARHGIHVPGEGMHVFSQDNPDPTWEAFVKTMANL
ncbi:MAG: hypothetical protein OXR66_08540 [Candidatus Woesearchaeota archaeon]|nr:hypothetical protein [Candidatus Woesearchaeota archaeon]